MTFSNLEKVLAYATQTKMAGLPGADSGGKNQRLRAVGVLEKASYTRSVDCASWEDTSFPKVVRNAAVRGASSSITNRLSAGTFHGPGRTVGDAVMQLLSLVTIRVMEPPRQQRQNFIRS